MKNILLFSLRSLAAIVLFIASFLAITPSARCQWVQTPGITTVQIHSFALSGTNLFAGNGSWPSASGVYLSTNDGASWAGVNNGLTNLEVHALISSGANLLAGTAGGVFRSSDNGASWANIGLPSVTVSVLVSSGTNLFAGSFNYPSHKGIFLSTDNGATWNSANGSTDWSTLGVTALAVSGGNLLAGVSFGADGSGGMMRSSDNGGSWSAVTGLPKKGVKSFATIGSNLFAAIYGAGVYLSTDNGGSWTAVNTGMGNVPTPEALAVSGTKLFAGGNSSSIYLSTDYGTTWSSVNQGFPDGDQFQSLIVSGTNLFAGTGSGVWKRPLSEFNSSGVALNNAEQTAITLCPNPTNSIVRVRGIPAGSSIEVINVLGENIMKLASPGISECTLDLSRVPAGTYYLRVSSASSSITRMIVKE